MEVKALIDKEKKRVVFLECYADLVDVLFSFLTMPMATIIKLTRDQPSTKAMIGSMNNLYQSVESLDVKHFSACVCKDMLLRPRSGAESQLRRIRPRLQSDKVYDYFLCQIFLCSQKLFSYYIDAYCHCGNIMSRPTSLYEPALEEKGKGVFVEGLTRYLISDELQIVPLSTAASCSLLSKHGLMNGSDIEQRTLNIGDDEILSLLKSLFVSKTPLTDTLLLKNRTEQEPNQEYFDQIIAIQQERITSASRGDDDICLNLIIDKTKEAVCYAEAAEDFVNLLFSFLTIPLGNIGKEMNNGLSNGCVHHLYQSVQSLDSTKYLISEEIKQLLLCPKIAPHFGLEKQLLGIQEDVTKKYYFGKHRASGTSLATDKSLVLPFDYELAIRELKLLDPKSSYTNKETKSSDGYLKGPAMFTITDDLVITPISALSGLSVLSQLNVPFTNIEERIVNVSKEEATRLLVASLISKSPLTDVLIRQVPKLEY